MTITAKFRGTCAACGGTVNVGDQIEWSKGNPTRHTTCPGTRAAAPSGPQTPKAPKTPNAPRVAPGPIQLSGGSGYDCNGWTVGQVIASKGHAGSTLDLRRSEYETALQVAIARIAPEKLAYTLWDGAPDRSAYADNDSHQAAVATWKTATDFAARSAAWQRTLAADDQARRDANKTARAELAAQFPDDDGPRWLMIVTADQRYIREDGMSFGVGDDRGYVYSATARVATDEEAAPLKASRRAGNAARACSALLASALKWDAPGVTNVVDTGQLPPKADREVEWTSKGGTDKDTTYVLTATTIIAHHRGFYDDYRSTTRTIARDERIARIVQALATNDDATLAVLSDTIPQEVK